LSRLIEAGKPELAEEVCKHYEEADDEHEQPFSPYYSASWLLLRANITNPDYLPERPLKTLLWASQFGGHCIEVESEAVSRSLALQRLLIKETNLLVQRMNSSGPQSPSYQSARGDICGLWSNLFAPLLKVGIANEGVSYKAALVLASSCFPSMSDWGPLVSQLSRCAFRN
jgi:hypothetical protein